MLVKTILNSKAMKQIVTVTPNSTVADAATLLAQNGIGTVVVSTDGMAADGILSERDIVRQLAKTGADCLSQPVSEYMTTKLVTCTSDANVQTPLEQMTSGHFRHMPVVDDGKLIGVITLGDVVKAQLSHVEMEKTALEGMIMGH